MRFASGVLCVVLLLPGCSLMFSHGPPGGHETLEYFDCNSNMAAPATDAVFGGTYALGALILAAASRDDHVGDGSGEGAAIAGALSAPFLASMVYGFIECNACAKAKQQLRDRQLAAESSKNKLIADLQRQLELTRQPLQLVPAAPIVISAPPAAPAVPGVAPAAPAQAAPAPSPAAEPAAPALPGPAGETAPALP
jgi:hypothetical protein